ncbi:methionyl-trna formyltransferase : Methionyl-tRNA formyltransferase OS=Planctomyces brasiliensis (strain ATCC 49424 / DSM 5305 / JCM 21570 / NBRC 103401 / IFAM 1448) GN=fmt PE=3 SV=1: Formyl_trans_N: Formyl_trans_C [Gemmata massiliana]|uniref:Methionyl-tRNA formyltransferase n=1 Tax=Gemmata massiliana TaxID=1210884 RepID=A0A6P2DLQ2_9BACT|nr:methionyl-tRNA formyltransferase [Gemmata massiliana]VTS02697.1 methionyl-trna formyltransferase : Methionyl-tRNA formyltransferase OS=Planctomyces brasiliensis (strain ATCC 49424 / DSM 5305 / JCM 21570 / NBRC 103401 / IFAM 1448) GN=fmt PE=3 SV=1: Formyl_trans_N: Formyl_trans_C [Gemmata massiliana]
MRIVMMGTGTFAEPTFEALIAAFGNDVVGLVTQPERDAGNKRGSTRQTGKGMANIARAANISVAQPESINTPEGLVLLRGMQPDLLVVAAYGQILSRDVLTVPTRGTINVHASLLPKYRGAAPVAYAILSGEQQTGVTIIKVTPGLDSGDMILQESLDILPTDTTGSLEARLSTLGAHMAVEATRKYATGGPVEGVKQDPALVTKAPKIKKEFGLIDWTKPADYTERHVRGMQPWPTAYTFLHRPGKEPMRVIVTTATEFPVRSALEVPAGRPFVDAKFPQSLFVVGGQLSSGERSVLEVQELQPAGKKKMTAEEFLRGYPIVEGMRFGPEVLV